MGYSSAKDSRISAKNEVFSFSCILVCRPMGRAIQGRRKPNVGPGPAQISRISGFVNTKTDRENAAVLSKL